MKMASPMEETAPSEAAAGQTSEPYAIADRMENYDDLKDTPSAAAEPAGQSESNKRKASEIGSRGSDGAEGLEINKRLKGEEAEARSRKADENEQSRHENGETVDSEKVSDKGEWKEAPKEKKGNSGPSISDSVDSSAIGFPAGVRAKLEALIEGGVIERNDLDDRCLKTLSVFPEETGVEILQNFAEADMSRVRNKSGFLAGIIQRYGKNRQQEAQPSKQDSSRRGRSSSSDKSHASISSIRAELDALHPTARLSEQVEASVIEELASLPDQARQQAIAKFAGVDPSSVNNKSGFLRGIIRRIRSKTQVVQPANLVSLRKLPPPSHERMQGLVSSGFLPLDQVEEKCIDKLCSFPDDLQLQIIDRLATTDLEQVRNLSGFFLGMLKRYRQDFSTAYKPSMRVSPLAELYMQYAYDSVATPSFNAAVHAVGGMHGRDESQMFSMHPESVGLPRSAMSYGAQPGRSSFLSLAEEKLEELSRQGRLKEPIDDNIMQELRELPDSAAREVMRKFSEVDLDSIKNKSGFLKGIIRRVTDNPGRKADLTTWFASFNHLPTYVQNKLHTLFDSGVLSQNDLEARVLDSLARFPEYVAAEMVDRFAESNLQTVRNKNGFLVGIMKRHSDER